MGTSFFFDIIPLKHPPGMYVAVLIISHLTTGSKLCAQDERYPLTERKWDASESHQHALITSKLRCASSLHANLRLTDTLDDNFKSFRQRLQFGSSSCNPATDATR